MRNPACYTALLLFLVSCKLSSENIAGTYQQGSRSTAKLILRKDQTFEFAGRKNLISPVASANRDSTFKILTSGTWEYRNKQVWLNSFDAPDYSSGYGCTDSIARFTSISSFNFWDRYGEPVSIRSIHFTPSRAKPHFGNSLYLFAQDFKRTDTLVFQLDGYPDFRYPGSIPFAIGNNMHKIVLWEPYQPSLFRQVAVVPKRKKMLVQGNDLVLTKRN